MSDGKHDTPTTSPSESDNGSGSSSTLESAASYLAGSTAAGGAGDGSRSPFAASFEQLLGWGEATELIRPESDFPFLQRPPDGFGEEHQAWFEESNNFWYKATYPNQFGLAWDAKAARLHGNTYLGLILQNHFFADSIELVALVNCSGKLRVLTSQPHIPGDHALGEEIKYWFLSLGFERLESDGCIAWYRKLDNLLVADAHEGNVIRNTDRHLFAIDLNIIEPCGDMLVAVLSLLNGNP